MSEEKAIWEGWYDVAKVLNPLVPWITIGLGVVAWIVYTAPFWFLLGFTIWILIFPVVAAILYLIFVQKKVADKDLSKMTHIWLIICLAVGIIGPYVFQDALIIFMFVMVSILSEKPIWKAFGE